MFNTCIRVKQAIYLPVFSALARHTSRNVADHRLDDFRNRDQVQVAKDRMLETGSSNGKIQRPLRILIPSSESIDWPWAERITPSYAIDDMCNLVGGCNAEAIFCP